MNGTNLYEFAIIRYIPDIERGEFMNVGLAMMCKRKRWMRVQTHIDARMLELLHSPVDTEQLQNQLMLFERVGNGMRNCGPIAPLEAEERFRWLTAVKSSVLQTSRPHAGKCDDLDETFDALFARLISR